MTVRRQFYAKNNPARPRSENNGQNGNFPQIFLFYLFRTVKSGKNSKISQIIIDNFS